MVYSRWGHIYEVFLSEFNTTPRSFAEWINEADGNDYDYLIHMFVDAYAGTEMAEA